MEKLSKHDMISYLETFLETAKNLRFEINILFMSGCADEKTKKDFNYLLPSFKTAEESLAESLDFFQSYNSDVQDLYQPFLATILLAKMLEGYRKRIEILNKKVFNING